MFPWIKILKIHRKDLKELETEALKSYPLEACALLMGVIDEGKALVTDLLITKNIDESSIGFTISPEILFDALNKADREGKEIIGIFHSHPAPPQPSSVDLMFMKLNPVVWLIMSMIDRQIAAYQQQGDKVQKLFIEEI
ncbi:MAG: Mov34/MPN/PAD-1 family protein [Nitrososphaerales archaeon]